MKKLLILFIIFASCGGSGSDNSSEPTPSTTSKKTLQETTEETPVQNFTEEQENVEPPQMLQDRQLIEYSKSIQMASLQLYLIMKLLV